MHIIYRLGGVFPTLFIEWPLVQLHNYIIMHAYMIYISYLLSLLHSTSSNPSDPPNPNRYLWPYVTA